MSGFGDMMVRVMGRGPLTDAEVARDRQREMQVLTNPLTGKRKTVPIPLDPEDRTVTLEVRNDA